jgi:maleate isomerase
VAIGNNGAQARNSMVAMDESYGYRARIGYTSPPLLTEVFARDFYRLAPAGVTLVLTSLAILDRNKDEVDRSYEISIQAARAMALSGVDLVVLGGVTINLSRGYANADRMLVDLSSELGVKVISSAAAQSKALTALGTKKLVIARPYPRMGDFHLGEYAGRTVLGAVEGNTPFRDIARLKPSVALELGREAMRAYPDADTIMFPSPHWPVVDAIEPLERELGVSVMGALQAIVWDALRQTGIHDRIDGFGRLLREH